MIKFIFISFSLFTACSLLANDYDNHIKRKYLAALHQIAESEKECSSKATVLHRDPLKSLSLSKEQVKVIVNYFYLKNGLECAKESYYNFFGVYAAYAARHHSKIDTEMQSSSELVFTTFNLFHKAEAKYSLLPLELKQRLEKIDGLRNPILPIETMEKLLRKSAK